MRIISQDGTMDMPYEMSTMWCDDGAVLLQPIGEIGEYQTFAKYSTKEKAIKAIEMLREAYAGKSKLNVDEIPNLIPQEFEGKLGIGDILLCDKANTDVSFSSNYYFQFPQDDEIEV